MSNAEHLMGQVLNREVAHVRTLLERMEADELDIAVHMSTIDELIELISSSFTVDPRVINAVNGFKLSISNDL